MINQSALYNLFRANTGKSIYQVRAMPESNEQRWQPARVQEYAFQGITEVG